MVSVGQKCKVAYLGGSWLSPSQVAVMVPPGMIASEALTEAHGSTTRIKRSHTHCWLLAESLSSPPHGPHHTRWNLTVPKVSDLKDQARRRPNVFYDLISGIIHTHTCTHTYTKTSPHSRGGKLDLTFWREEY